MATMKPPAAWYRHIEPWLLLIAPLVAVIGGVFTLWFAVTTNNSMVVDDYYREGRAINQTFARDAEARRLGLSAQWEIDVRRNLAHMSIKATDSGFMPPEQVVVRLIHATESNLDHRVLLSRVAPDLWEAPFAAPTRARWTLQVEDPARSWRLIASLSDPAAALALVAPGLGPRTER